MFLDQAVHRGCNRSFFLHSISVIVEAFFCHRSAEEILILKHLFEAITHFGQQRAQATG